MVSFTESSGSCEGAKRRYRIKTLSSASELVVHSGDVAPGAPVTEHEYARVRMRDSMRRRWRQLREPRVVPRETNLVPKAGNSLRDGIF